MSSDSGIKGARTLGTQGEQRKVFAVEDSFVTSKEWKERKSQREVREGFETQELQK